jgi:hypothetical protein
MGANGINIISMLQWDDNFVEERATRFLPKIATFVEERATRFLPKIATFKGTISGDFWYHVIRNIRHRECVYIH